MSSPSTRFPSREALLDFKTASYLLSNLEEFPSEKQKQGVVLNDDHELLKSRPDDKIAYLQLTNVANLLVRSDEIIAIAPAKEGYTMHITQNVQSEPREVQEAFVIQNPSFNRKTLSSN